VLTSGPSWADGFLDKTQVDRVIEAIDDLYAKGFSLSGTP
jgi:hypothetical protein